VKPQLGENIGTAARAMANFGLSDLRLVAPRDGWPNARAIAASSKADHVISAARVYDRLEDAIADRQFVYATTARNRDMPKTVSGPREAVANLRTRIASGEGTAILFGRERWGLTNEEVLLADEIVTFPVNPQFASLNIAQAVLLMSYEWMGSGLAEGELPTRLPTPEQDDPIATKAELIGLMEHLEGALDGSGYFRTPNMRAAKVRNLRALLQRRQFSGPEIQVLRGVISALERRYGADGSASGQVNDGQSGDG
ncbi:MAG: RNA methyltransferase, partial [Alphaproteobacteria bacterium]